MTVDAATPASYDTSTPMDFYTDTQGYIRQREPEFTFTTTDPVTLSAVQHAINSGTTIIVTTPGGLRFNAYVTRWSYEGGPHGYGSVPLRAHVAVKPTGAPLEPLTNVERTRRLVDVTCYGDRARKFLDASCDPGMTTMKQALDRASRELKAATARACYDEAQDILRTASCHPSQSLKKEKTPVKIKKFYVASKPTVEGTDGRGWAKDTLAEAIAHATQLARERGEAQYVVRVIKVVAKRDEPVTVKDVK